MTRFLISSLVATVVLNLALRFVPGLPERASRWLGSVAGQRPPADATRAAPPSSRVRVFVPWKAMLIGSIGLTVLINLVAVLR